MLRPTDARVKLCFVEIVDNVPNGLDVAIPAWRSNGQLQSFAKILCYDEIYILKLPPTKNWRPIFDDIPVDLAWM